MIRVSLYTVHVVPKKKKKKKKEREREREGDKQRGTLFHGRGNKADRWYHQ